jgi:hypothetical protein
MTDREGAGGAPEEAAAAPAPEAFDEVDPADLPQNVSADFVPPETATRAAPGRHDLDPFQHDSLQAQEAFDAAAAAEPEGDEEATIQRYIRAAKIAETAREWQLAAVACQRVGDFLLRPPPPMDLERAFRMYRRAVAAYDQCGLFAEASRLAYRQLCLKMRHARHLGLPWLLRLELYLYWAAAGFGYRPLRVIGAAALIVLCYGFVYWLTGGVVHNGAREPLDLWRAIYFSGVTFATVGYGDFIPAPHARLLALTEGFLGVFSMGLFVAVLANRLSRA